MNFGIEIIGNNKNIIDHLINQKLNPELLSPIELYQLKYSMVSKEEILAIISSGTDEAFYINRTRGDKYNKTYYTLKSELITLLEEQIGEFDGLDLLVASDDFTWVFVTNHDGDIYKVS